MLYRILITIAVSLLPVTAGAAAPQIPVTGQQFLSQWQEGYLDIHAIATGKGDATFLILPDGTRMLIDSGDMTGVQSKGWNMTHPLPYDGRTPGQWIAKYILDFSRGFSEPEKLDYFLLTHFHADHFGHKNALRPGPDYGLAGIMEVGEQIHFDKIVDRGYPSYDFPSKAAVERAGEGSIGEYIKFVKWQVANKGTKAEQFQIGSRKQFPLTHNPAKYKDSFKIRNIAANAHVTTGKGLGKRPMYTKDEDPEKFDENMFSTVFRLDYGKFSYYYGGDIPGNNWPTKAKFNRDYESIIAPFVGAVTAMKADHHATRDSSNPYFLWVTRPDVIVIPASESKHPWKDTFDRYNDPQAKGRRMLFVTSDAGREQIGEERWAKFPPTGHVVIRVYEGGKAYQVFVLNASSGSYEILYSTERIEL